MCLDYIRPSGLPTIQTLGLHNGGLIAFLVAKQSEQLVLRQDSGPNGLLVFTGIVIRLLVGIELADVPNEALWLIVPVGSWF